MRKGDHNQKNMSSTEIDRMPKNTIYRNIFKTLRILSTASMVSLKNYMSATLGKTIDYLSK